MRKFENWKRAIPSLIILAVLLASMAAGVTYAKYVTNAQLDGSVQITANLGNIEVIESKAQRNPDGSYELLPEITTQNTYYLLPGLDIPKDPKVRITEKSSIGVYVYLVIDTNITPSPTGVSFELQQCWKKLDGYDNVYVYCGDQANAVAVTDKRDIAILKSDAKGNSVFVSQKLNTNISDTLNLNFTAVMKQVVDGMTAKEIFADNTDY